MNKKVDYKETIRAPYDHLVADIYKVDRVNLYVIKFYSINDHAKHFLGHRLRITLGEYTYLSIKDEIKEELFQQVLNSQPSYQKAKQTRIIA